MERKLQVTLISNAGLLLKYNGTVLLLDGIYRDGILTFSAPPPEVWEAILAGKPPFEQIDYLLFTHAHPDHFSPERTMEYLNRRSVKGVFLPQVPSVEYRGLASYLLERHIPAMLFPARTDRITFNAGPEITVQAFATRHLDKQYETVRHFCYLIRFGDRQVLFTADVDYTTETFAGLESVRLRAVFVNPLFYSVLRWKKFFKGHLDTQSVCVYHIPFAEDDSLGLRSQLARNAAAWPEEDPETIILDEPLQQITL